MSLDLFGAIATNVGLMAHLAARYPLSVTSRARRRLEVGVFLPYVQLARLGDGLASPIHIFGAHPGPARA